MPIIKNRDAAFNYGCLMAELKEKMALFRSRLNKGEEENQGSLIENKCKDESKIGRDSLISETELNFSLNVESSTKVIVCSDRMVKENESEIMVESGIDNVDESRLGLSSDSRVFPYPICFVSKSLPTPPKDYNLRKTGINFNTSKYLESEEIACNRVSRKLMFLVDERNEGKNMCWQFKKENDNDDNYNLAQNQIFEEPLDRENSFVSQRITSRLKNDDEKEKKINPNTLDLPKTIKAFQLSERNIIQKEQISKANKLLQDCQSMENIQSFNENLASKSESFNFFKTKSLSDLEKGSNVTANTINNNKYATMNTTNNSNINENQSIYKQQTQMVPIIKNKILVSRQRGNIITNRYYKMASQLRVIN
ncbi:uncharacterized protein cubi_03307 [Cryptosporidium ubiquitum]|uniref:Uncharacterized protein n=1 Tax=Cryptosporidium ubiquitum TaxID=857276 RepID=A0A1J4MGI5_9CRYT|nr:uncharacterized protein cubi_03307 [Cryptosporidium ubiquitum]OII72571.1 hypothetical protein cubi_03307 [Cryptosporidium ubiquitum]